jgi:putative ABC transport system permease protein
LLTAFIINELTFDTFHVNHNRLYRVESKVVFKDRTTDFAVTPLPIGDALREDIPEIEDYCRFIYEEKPVFRVGQAIFNDEVALAADSNFLQILTFDFVQGDKHALRGPDKIVLTQTLASKLFATEDPIGQTIEFGDGFLLEVAAVIKDVPANSHLSFDALISWETFDREDGWDNLNAYTYILLKPGASIDNVRAKIPSVMEAIATLSSATMKQFSNPPL